MDWSRSRLIPWISAALLVAASTLPRAGAGDDTGAEAAATLAGSYRLDPARSDDGREKMREAMGSGGHGEGGHGETEQETRERAHGPPPIMGRRE